MRAIRKGVFMKSVDYSKIGERIKSYRSKKGLSQEQLSLIVLADSKHLSGIENGKRRPSLELIIQIANALSVSADDILVDSLDYSAAMDEIHTFLMGCTETEREILNRFLKFLKELFIEFSI